jgi:saccharopine dehydrogenase-like NADP-dependent oxidoreductase
LRKHWFSRYRAKHVVEKIGTNNVSWIQTDVTKYEELVDTLKGFDFTMGFLPGNLGYRVAEACIEARKDLVDVSYMAQDPLKLHRAALKARVAFIPDCGLAPGISNILVGHAVTKLEEVEAVHIMVGGIPEKPVPPLGYTITWSPESLIDEYTRKSKIVRRGKKIEVEALSGLEEITHPTFGRLEAFYTDGLRTLLQTMKDVDDMWEKTLRYPGHAEKIELLKALGFFDVEKIEIDDISISPRKFTAKLFERKLLKPQVRDIVILEAHVSGIEEGKRTTYAYHLLDFYHQKQRITAMARTTAYPMSIVAQLVLRKRLKEKGVVPLEKIGMNDELFKLFLDGLRSRGITVSEVKTTG